MHIVYLFASFGTFGVPAEVISHIQAIYEQLNGNVKFIIGDNANFDSSLNKLFASLGYSKNVVVYSLGYVKHNDFGLPTKVFSTEFIADKNELHIKSPDGTLLEIIDNVKSEDEAKLSIDYNSFLDKQLVNDCTFAICCYDGTTKKTFNTVNRLKILNKYVYIYGTK